MKFRSYAQNFEDVILNRVFKDQASGFYFDVGACNPHVHSVTKHFYERGWHGINIEPGSQVFQQIVRDRERDINLNVGLSREEGTLTFFEAPSSIGRSTFRAQWKNDWNQRDGCEFEEKTVPVTTLNKVFEEHVGDILVDFLKIDVEGHEAEVLQGGDFQRWRPRVILIEGSPDVARDWDASILGADYHFATFDGINCYYVRGEDRHLIPILATPVSIVDEFELDEHLRVVEHLNSEIAGLRRRVDELEAEAAGHQMATARIEDLERQLASSSSQQTRGRKPWWKVAANKI